MSEQLRSIFDRWQNLEAAKVQNREDLKELFAEAKGNGFEPKALRLAFRQKVGEPETDADRALAMLVGSYLSALEFDAGVKRVRARAPARVEIIEKSAAKPAAKPVEDVMPEPASHGVTGVAGNDVLSTPYPCDDDPLGPDLPAYLVRHPAASMERG